MENSNNIGLIILAAGASLRLGSPKQLLEFQSETLLRRLAREALASECRPVAGVLGAQSDKCAAELKDLDVDVAENAKWKSGMGSSIKTGLDKILEINESIDAVVLTVCDQPFVTKNVINALIETYRQTKASIVASAYRETLGVPALFDKKLFPLLRELKEGGAKQIIRQFSAEAKSVSFPAGAIDIDTAEDFAKLSSVSQGLFEK